MVRKKTKKRTTFSFAIKKGGKFKPLPKLSKKQQKDVLLGRGKFKKIPPVYVVKKKGKRVVQSKKI